MEDAKRGDIYYIASNYQEEGSEQRAGRPAIIVSNDVGNFNAEIVTVVYLTTQPKKDLPTHVEITSSSRPSTALCEQLCTVSKMRLDNYVGTCSEEEMRKIDESLLISLGIEIPKIENKISQVEQRGATHDLEGYAEYRALEAERDVYKNMYESLLEKSLKICQTGVRRRLSFIRQTESN